MRLIWQAVATVIAFLLLVALGVWQLDRRATKLDLLERIAAAEAAPSTPLPLAVDASMVDAFRRVSAEGLLDHSRALFWRLEPRGSQGGTFLVVPLLREGAAPIWTVLGWIPERLVTEAPKAPPVQARVEGFLRPPGPRALFAPTDDTVTRRFFTLDPAAFSRASNLPEPVPGALVALGPAPAPGQFPDPARTLPRPSNDHLTYAFTWFGLAGALVAVALVHFRRRPDPRAARDPNP